MPWEFHATFGELRKPPGTKVSIEPKVFQIDEARNNQVERFLELKDYTHHLWLDDDMCLCDPSVLERLLQDNQPIVSGLYWRADYPHYPILLREYGVDNDVIYEFTYADKPYPKDKLIEVDAVGCGLLLVRREVYEKLKPPYFLWHGDAQQAHGEDMYFSRKVRAAGFKIYVDPRAEALHAVRTLVGSDEAKWAFFRRRYPVNSKKLAMIKKALASVPASSPSLTEPTGGASP
jgi:GT2 family glycosyltransferase